MDTREQIIWDIEYIDALLKRAYEPKLRMALLAEKVRLEELLSIAEAKTPFTASGTEN